MTDRADRLPPLNAVRVFVVAARHLSFTRAAAELHLTHGAVSRQVQKLESDLGVALFERRTRQLLLTPAGQQFLQGVAESLERIHEAARQLRTDAPRRTVRVNVRPSFAVKWLIPRLPDFVARHPGIEPQVQTSTLPLSAAAEAFDIGIRRGTEGWPVAMQVQPFLHDEALIVGAPLVLAALPVAEPPAIVKHVLLSSNSRPADWDDWKRAVGHPRLAPARRLRFDHLHFVVQAAVDGLGLAIAPRSLLSHDLAAGRLLDPLPRHRLPLAGHHCGSLPEASAEAQAFIAWLHEWQTRP